MGVKIYLPLSVWQQLSQHGSPIVPSFYRYLLGNCLVQLSAGHEKMRWGAQRGVKTWCLTAKQAYNLEGKEWITNTRLRGEKSDWITEAIGPGEIRRRKEKWKSRESWIKEWNLSWMLKNNQMDWRLWEGERRGRTFPSTLEKRSVYLSILFMLMQIFFLNHGHTHRDFYCLFFASEFSLKLSCWWWKWAIVERFVYLGITSIYLPSLFRDVTFYPKLIFFLGM